MSLSPIGSSHKSFFYSSDEEMQDEREIESDHISIEWPDEEIEISSDPDSIIPEPKRKRKDSFDISAQNELETFRKKATKEGIEDFIKLFGSSVFVLSGNENDNTSIDRDNSQEQLEQIFTILNNLSEMLGIDEEQKETYRMVTFFKHVCVRIQELSKTGIFNAQILGEIYLQNLSDVLQTENDPENPARWLVEFVKNTSDLLIRCNEYLNMDWTEKQAMCLYSCFQLAEIV